MNSFASLTLYPSGLIGYREERPVKSERVIIKETEESFNIRLQAWKDSGVTVEMFPGEEQKIIAHIKSQCEDWTIPVSAIERGFEVKDFVQLQEQAISKDGKERIVYALLKPPVETKSFVPTVEEGQQFNTNSEVGSYHWFATLMGQVIRMGEFIEKNPNDPRTIEYNYGKKIKETCSFIAKNFRNINNGH